MASTIVSKLPRKHRRFGFIARRIQAFNPRAKRWIESNTITGRFINMKSDSKPFKSVRRHKSKPL